MNLKALISELEFKAVRSSGSGGQHVNKVSSKVVLTFDVINSKTLTEPQKSLIYKNLSSRLTSNKTLTLFCDESRSQHKNKTIAIQRFIKLIEEALRQQKKRIATKTPKSIIKKRLEDKKKQSLKKANRKPPHID